MSWSNTAFAVCPTSAAQDPELGRLHHAVAHRIDVQVRMLPPGATLFIALDQAGDAVRPRTRLRAALRRHEHGEGHDVRLAFGGGWKVTLACDSREEAVRALSVLPAEGPSALIAFRVVEVEVELEPRAVVDLGLDVAGTPGEADLEMPGRARLKADLRAGTLAMERAFRAKPGDGTGFPLFGLEERGVVTFRMSARIPAEVVPAVKRGQLSLADATRAFLSTSATHACEVAKEGALHGLGYRGRRIIPLADPRDDWMRRARAEDAANPWSWEARIHRTVSGGILMPEGEIELETTAEIPLTRTRGSFTDFYTVAAHRTAEATRDTVWLLNRRNPVH